METALASFLAAYAEKQWQPGTVDCCLYLAAWAIWLGHRDPAEHLRGAYHDEAGYRAIIEREGGVVAVVSGCVSRIGGRLVSEPSIGSVGIVGSRSRVEMQFGAIFDGSRWALLTEHGTRTVVARPLAVWSI